MTLPPELDLYLSQCLHELQEGGPAQQTACQVQESG